MTSRMRPQNGLALAALLVVACGGAPSGSVPPTTGPIIPPITVPTIPPISLPSVPVGIPSIQIPSFVPDPVIDAAFPAQIDGQPLKNKSSANFMTLMVSLGTESATIDGFVSAMQALGVDPTAVSAGAATATVNDQTVTIQLLRFPGGNGAAALDAIVRVDPTNEVPTFTTQNIGGKNATVGTTSNGDVKYYYVNGELLWVLPSADEAQAAVIFAALP